MSGQRQYASFWTNLVEHLERMTYHAGAAVAGIDLSNSQNPNVMLLGATIPEYCTTSSTTTSRHWQLRRGQTCV